MPTSVVLLRGVNVGGHKLSMAALRDDLTSAGFRDVKTYIQSGNVVLTHSKPGSAALSQSLSERISALADYKVPVTLRTASELRSVVKSNPFDASDPTKLVVWFLDEKLPPRALDSLDVDYRDEAYKVSGREIFLSLPNGQARGILPVALAKLKVPALRSSTARNWRTVEKLLELATT